MTMASRVRQTLGNLHNVRATLEIYAMQSQDGDGRTVFREAAETAAAMAAEIAGHLKTLEDAEEPLREFS